MTQGRCAPAAAATAPVGALAVAGAIAPAAPALVAPALPVPCGGGSGGNCTTNGPAAISMPVGRTFSATETAPVVARAVVDVVRRAGFCLPRLGGSLPAEDCFDPPRLELFFAEAIKTPLSCGWVPLCNRAGGGVQISAAPTNRPALTPDGGASNLDRF